jgi:hypothetical protein
MDHRAVAVRAKKQDDECWQFAPLFVRPWHIAAASAQYAKGQVDAES